MSDTSLNKVIQYGTNAALLAFTPTPPGSSKVLYLFYDTDNDELNYWDGAAWVVIVDASSITGITALTGDVTATGPGSAVATIAAGVVTEAMQVLADNTTQNVSTTKHGYAPKAPNDATKYLDGTGAYTVPAIGTIGNLLDYIAVRKTSNESVTSSTALQDDNELLFAVGANETWIFRIVIVYIGEASASSGKIKIAVTAPSGTIQWSTMGKDGSGTTNAGTFAVNTGTVSGTAAGSHGSAGATIMHMIVDGIIVNGATPGNVVLQWAQQVSSGTATTVNANSFLEAKRIA